MFLIKRWQLAEAIFCHAPYGPDQPCDVDCKCRAHYWAVVGLLGLDPDDGPPVPSIVCPHCERRSYHPKDISERFCGVCGYHDQPRSVAPGGESPLPRGEPTNIVRFAK